MPLRNRRSRWRARCRSLGRPPWPWRMPEVAVVSGGALQRAPVEPDAPLWQSSVQPSPSPDAPGFGAPRLRIHASSTPSRSPWRSTSPRAGRLREVVGAGRGAAAGRVGAALQRLGRRADGCAQGSGQWWFTPPRPVCPLFLRPAHFFAWELAACVRATGTGGAGRVGGAHVPRVRRLRGLGASVRARHASSSAP